MKPEKTSTALLAPSPGPPGNLWDDIRLQKFWLSVDRRGWRSLAVLDAGSGVNTLPIGELVAQLSWRYGGAPSAVSDLRDLTMRLVEYQLREMRSQMDDGKRVVIALRSIFENPAAMSVAKQADAVVLCLTLGQTAFRGAEETIEAVGRERVLGAILLRPKKGT